MAISLSFEKLYDYLKTDAATLENKKAVLFPTCKQAEQNLKNIFLANLSSIKSFREKLLGDLVRPITNQSADLRAYSEIQCDNIGRPDALLVLTTGKKPATIAWTAFVETKLASTLEKEQVKRYYDLAKDMNIDALITISQDPTPTPLCTPFDFKKSKSVGYYHFSWADIKKACLMLIRDADNAFNNKIEQYLIEEFLRYLEDDELKIKSFVVNKSWKDDTEKLFENTQKKPQEIIARIACEWLQEEADLCFHIYKKTNIEVSPKYSNKPKSEYLEHIKNNILKHNSLITVFRENDRRESTLSINLSTRNGEISTFIPVDKADEYRHIALISELLTKFKNSGEEHNIILSASYGRNNFKSETIKKLQDEKKNTTTRSYSIADRQTKLKGFKISMKIDFEKMANFHIPQRFDEIVERRVELFFTHVMSAL